MDRTGGRKTHRDVDELVCDHGRSTEVEAELSIELEHDEKDPRVSVVVLSALEEEGDNNASKVKRGRRNGPYTPSRTIVSSYQPREG